nr:alpha/beta hydrolase [Granulosicoccus sp.]
VDNIDVSELLGKVAVPTLVVHAQNDGIHPLKQGKDLASGIIGAQFILLDSVNHVLLEQEPAEVKFQQEIRKFILG